MTNHEELASMRSMSEKELGQKPEFPDRNLDVLHERVASGMPQRPSTDMERLAAFMRTSGGGSLHLVLDEAGDWSASLHVDSQKDPLVGYGNTHGAALGALMAGWTSARPHVAAYEDDGSPED